MVILPEQWGTARLHGSMAKWRVRGEVVEIITERMNLLGILKVELCAP